MRKAAASAVFLALALALLGAGCGDDDGGGDGGSGAGAPAGTTGPTGAAGTAGATGGSGAAGTGSTDATGSTGATGAARDKANALVFRMTEFRFIPPAVSAAAGQVTIRARNVGNVSHQLILFETDQPPSTLPLRGGRVDEKAIDGEHVLDIEDVAPRKAKRASVRLAPGRYVFFCNLPHHYQAGMRGSLTVR